MLLFSTSICSRKYRQVNCDVRETVVDKPCGNNGHQKNSQPIERVRCELPVDNHAGLLQLRGRCGLRFLARPHLNHEAIDAECNQHHEYYRDPVRGIPSNDIVVRHSDL